MKKKLIIAVSIAVAILIIGGCLSSASAANKHKRHLPAKICVKQWDNHGWKKRQCKRQGWLYDVGSYPASTETTPWTMVDYVLVIGPNGRVWIDTSGFFTYPSGPVVR